MEDSPRKGEDGRPVRLSLDPKIPEQIEHDRWAKWGDESEGQATDGSNLLFELAGMAGFSGKMA